MPATLITTKSVLATDLYRIGETWHFTVLQGMNSFEDTHGTILADRRKRKENKDVTMNPDQPAFHEDLAIVPV